jgi:hypothetical protein
MLQVDNLLDAYRHAGREGDFAAEVDRQFRLVEEAGAVWVRAGVLWNQIERKPGEYHWHQADAVVRAARRHHARLVWLVGGTPGWNGRDTEGPPRELPDPHFRRFLHELLARYGGAADPAHPLAGSVRHWEIINEPNYHWKPEQYAVALAEARRVLRADPEARVVFGGLGGDLLSHSKDVIAGNQVAYFEQVVRHLPAGERPFDCANFHLYGNDADRFFQGDDALDAYFGRCQEEIRKALKRTGLEGMPVWSTEFDYPSAVKHQVRGPYKGDSPAEGPQKQARFLTDWFPKILGELPDRKVFWASLVDDVNDQGAFLSTGLCRWQSADDHHGAGEPKPAYQALKRLLRPTP